MRCNGRNGRRFKTWVIRQPPQPRITEIEPDDLATHVSLAEKDVLPMIAERQLSPVAAQFLLAQQRQTLVMGDPRFILESRRNMANAVLVLWETGYYKPGPDPNTLEVTLLLIVIRQKPRATLKQSAARAGREGPIQRLQPLIGRYNRRQVGNRSSFSTKRCALSISYAARS